jgi:hypothetical protein
MVQTSVDPDHVRRVTGEYGVIYEDNLDGTFTTISCPTINVWYPWQTATTVKVRKMVYTPGGGGAASKLQTSESGDFDLKLTATFSGTGNATFQVAVFVNSVRSDVVLERKLGTGGDVGNATDTGNLSLTGTDEVSVQVRCVSQSSTAFNIGKLTLNVVRTG